MQGECSMSADDERAAVLSLALASLPNEEEVREALFANKERPPPPLAEALQTLHFLTQERQRVSHRVLSLDLLAKIAHRRGYEEALVPAEAELFGFMEAAVAEGERTEPPEDELHDLVDEEERASIEVPDTAPRSDDDRVNQAVDALRAAEQIHGETHWATFARFAQRPLLLSAAEVDRPVCTDDRIVEVDGLKAVRTAVWFWSDRPATDFAAWTDPRSWALNCPLFFQSMVLKAGQSLPANAPEFTATFTETVVIDDETTLSTDLVFNRGIAEPYLYALTFDLPPPPLPQSAPIVVDAGQVTVREDKYAPASQRTSLLCEKLIRFSDPAYLTWPTLACDTFWTEFAVTMANGCSSDQ
jgi:hypothetical protein